MATIVEGVNLNSKQNREQLLRKLITDQVFFNSLLLGDMFDIKIPKFHKQVYEALNDRNKQLVIIQMPRGFGKTTILQGYMLSQIVHQNYKVIVYVSDTYSQAKLHTEAVREQLECNDKLINLYGSQVSKNWAEAQFETAQGTTVIPKGSDQSIRGIKVGIHRPDMVIIDDPENDLNSLTLEQRDKLWQHLFAVIKPMMKADKKSKIVWLGTPICEDCVLYRLMELFKDRSGAAIIQLAAEDEGGHSIWPDLWPDSRLQDTKQLYSEAGMLHVYYREYMGTILAPQDAMFPIKQAFYYKNDELPKVTRTYMSIDLAFSQRESADFCAAIVFSVSSKEKSVYVRTAVKKRMKPDEFLTLLMQLYMQYNIAEIYVQNVVLDAFFKFYASEKYMLPFKVVKVSRQKDAKYLRIASLEPLFKSGRLKFQRDQVDLLGELAQYPRAKHDDMADALAFGVAQLSIPGYRRKATSNIIEFGSLEHIRRSIKQVHNIIPTKLMTPPFLRGGSSCH